MRTLQLLCCGANGAELAWDVWGKQVVWSCAWLAGRSHSGWARAAQG